MHVSLAFRLYDGGGDLLDEVTADEPLTYVHGYAQVLPGLEAGLEGAAAGQERSIVLFPEDAFGEHDPEAMLEIDRNDFPEAEQAEVGGEIVATGPDGTEAVHRILSVTDDAIIVDLNHPYAGEILRFEVTVCAVREATDEELEGAHADVDDRIAMVYGSQSDDLGDPSPPHPGVPNESLVQIRVPEQLRTRTEDSDE